MGEGETSEEALCRELGEEIGVRLLLILLQVCAALRRTKPPIKIPEAAFD